MYFAASAYHSCAYHNAVSRYRDLPESPAVSFRYYIMSSVSGTQGVDQCSLSNDETWF